jgi:hypothetical protein
MDVASSDTGMGTQMPRGMLPTRSPVWLITSHSVSLVGQMLAAVMSQQDSSKEVKLASAGLSSGTGAAKTRGMNRPNMAMKIWKSIFLLRYDVKNIGIRFAVQDC